jgi:hypothetical protein
MQGTSSKLAPTEMLKVTDGTPIALKYKGETDEKWALIANVEERSSTFGKFLVNPVPETERAASDSYFIAPHSNGKELNLRVKRAGAPSDAKAEQICVLFARKYDDGTTVFKGKDKRTNIRYLVGPNKYAAKATSAQV